MKKWIISISVFILSFAVSAFVGFYGAIFLVGPHSDVLPEILQVPVGLLLWLLIIGIPFLIARKTFKKLNHKKEP